MFKDFYMKRKRGSETPTFPWESDLGEWKIESTESVGRGSYGTIYECSRGKERAVCKVIEWNDTRKSEIDREIECQRLCARFAPRVFHSCVGQNAAVIVMEKFPTNIERVLAQLWGMFSASFDVFAQILADLLPRFLLQIDGFRAPCPHIEIIHGDLTPQNVLFRFVGNVDWRWDEKNHSVPEFQLVACDFGYSTLYASGLACDPFLAHSRFRRPLSYDPCYDRCFFVATTLGMVSRWSGVDCKEWVALLSKLGPAREGLRPSLAEDLQTAVRYVKRFSKHDLWQDCAGWAPYFSKSLDLHSESKK